jgi:hypothetical protein
VTPSTDHVGSGRPSPSLELSEGDHGPQLVQPGAELGAERAGLGCVRTALILEPPAIAHFEEQQRLLDELRIVDVDLSCAPELVDAYLRVGRADEAAALVGPSWPRRGQGAAVGDGSRGALPRACGLANRAG